MNGAPTGGVTYYLIFGHRLGKRDGRDFLYQPGQGWVPDLNHLISDKLMGYSPGEPAGSPYSMFNMSDMEQIETISEQQARAHQAKLDRDGG